jgi:2-dehydro-3-deoxyphosphooctonate aldolase (KDO 8-P synthase)
MELYNDIIKGNVLIAGPCIIEKELILFKIAEKVKKISIDKNFTYVFKASFDKANRTSASGYRGSGIKEGLRLLEKIKKEFELPITTDIHESYQAEIVKDVVDIIQIPAFLSRQTDLLIAAGETGKIVNIKKAQFLSGNQMIHPVNKVLQTGNNKIILTERGSMFGYQNIVVDYTGIIDMIKLGYPVVFDATHSVQRPGSLGSSTGGNREYAKYLALAAASIGIRGFFFEVHPNPEEALSDGPNSIYLDHFESILQSLKAVINLQNVNL